jgi:ABC-2 type transport system permease protein
MRHVLTIGHNDLRLFLRNRAAWIWLLVVPLAFVYFMGFANRGPGDPSRPRPEVLVESEDAGPLGAALIGELGVHGLGVVSPTNREAASRAIRIPEFFSSRISTGGQGRVSFQALDSSGDPASVMVQVRLVRALVALNSRLIDHAARHGGRMPTSEDGDSWRQSEDQVRVEARFAGRKPIPTGFNLSLPGVLVMYLMMNLLVFGGTTLATERRNGVLRRIATQPVTRGNLIAGKIYGLVLLAAVQIAVMLAIGRFGLGVNLGGNLGGVLLVLIVYAWVAGSFGVWIGSWVRQDDRIVGLCVMLSIAMAALGGCWWPLEIVPDSMKFLAHVVPTGWAMDALHQLITYGNGLAGAREEIGMLLLYGAAASLGASRSFRV